MGKNTNLFSDLDFRLDTEVSNGYGSVTKMVSISYEKFIRNLQKQALEWNSRSSKVTRMNGTVICRPPSIMDKRCFLTVDCDTEHMFDIAINVLKTDFDYEYVVINSSPGHRWIICNVRMLGCNLVETLNHIPGCDNNYILHTEKRKVSALRAAPKGHIKPEFEDFSHLKESPFKKWVQSFYNFWQTEEMQWICDQMLINNL